jgi:hypothetical protein
VDDGLGGRFQEECNFCSYLVRNRNVDSFCIAPYIL